MNTPGFTIELMEAFTHLHVHSYYSFLEGLPSPTELIETASRYEMGALALTDRIYLTGAIEFYQACQEAGIQPIIGLEIPVSSPLELSPTHGDLVLLASNLSGWRSLCRLSSAILTNPKDHLNQVLSFDRFAQESEGLICLTGSERSHLIELVRAGHDQAADHYLGQLSELFPDSLYIELQRRTLEEEALSKKLAQLGKKLNFPIVAANSIYYIHQDQADLQKLVTAIRLNRPLVGITHEIFPPQGSAFTSGIEMQRRFRDYPQSIVATQEIAERCRLELPLDTPRFPKVSLPEGKTAIQVLQNKAEEGAYVRYGKIDARISKRLDHELSVIEDRGYAPLFLIMKEILDYARHIGVPISSRGSAASSLIAYCLEITTPDPLELDLYFERFLNPARATPPDIDTDISSRHRDEVIDFVYRRFGEKNVAMVATINRFRHRSALREVAKAHGFPPGEVKKLTDQVPWRWWRSRPQMETPYDELIRRFPDPHYQKLLKDAAALIGLPRHLSIHPGGMVISPGPMTDLVPTQLATKGVVITQFDLESVSRTGLVKIDLLGIRGLSVLGDVAAELRSRDPHAYESSLDALDAIPEHDPATAELVKAGRTIGCFQIESPGMRATLKEIQAQTMDDVMIALALYRPGPLTGGLKDSFVRRHRGEELVTHLHPALSQILEDTYGVILYQEQVLRIAHELAGLSLAEADLLRRAMSHFDPGEQMITLKEKFVTGAWSISGIPRDTADTIWELMAAFAGYGFPKAHAASYAQISWQAAWSKTHEPATFMAAVLANWGGYYEQRVYLNEVRRMGLTLRPPHVNYSQRQFSVSHQGGKPFLYMGLDQVRELTRRSQDRIIESRPFRSLSDFLVRVDPRPVEAENLIRVSALEGFGSIPQLLRQSESGDWRGGQLAMFTEISGPGTKEQDWSLEEKILAEEEILGISVSAHRLELYAEQISQAGALTTVEAAPRLGERLSVAGVRLTWQRRSSQSGEYLYLMDLEDLEGMLLVMLPADLHRRHRKVFSKVHPFIVEGVVRLEGRFNEPAILAEKIWKLG